MGFVSWFEPRFKPAIVRAALAATLVAVCAGAQAPNAVGATAAKSTSTPARSTTHRASAAATRTSPPSVRHTLPFIADDYTRALAEARARKVPIFVESWAPW